MSFKPLLAAPVDFAHLDYSNLWLSAKLDGIRAMIINGVVVSRNLKPIRNQHIQRLYGGRPEIEGYDGELIVGCPTAKDCYQVTNSGVMSADGEPDVTFHVFDWIGDPQREYQQRLSMVDPLLAGISKVSQSSVNSYDDLLRAEENFLNQGYEGAMLRRYRGPQSYYKFGRSTAKEGTLLKLKRFVDAEATVVDVEEEMANNNLATTNALGRTERSAHVGNKSGKGRLGALICKTPDGVEFRIGTGFTAQQREQFWGTLLTGLTVKYKSFEIGVKDAPRFPVFLGWRDSIDI